MRPLFLAAALTLTGAPAALAADCRVNMRITNPTSHHITVQIESRTRANPTWFGGGQGGRLWRLAPGSQMADTLSFPVAGCGFNREVRATVACLAPAADGGYDASRPPVARRVLQPLGDGLQRPRDFSLRASC